MDRQHKREQVSNLLRDFSYPTHRQKSLSQSQLSDRLYLRFNVKDKVVQSQDLSLREECCFNIKVQLDDLSWKVTKNFTHFLDFQSSLRQTLDEPSQALLNYIQDECPSDGLFIYQVN